MSVPGKKRSGRRTRLFRLFVIAALALASRAAWSHASGGENANPWTSWPLSLEILLPVIIAGSLYTAGLMRRRDRGGITAWRHASFFGGLAALLVALQSPLDALAEHSFVMHQVQHLFLRSIGPMLLLLAAPQALLIAGMPEALREHVLRPLLASRLIETTFGFFAHHLVATLLLLAVPLFWHLPQYHNLSVVDLRVHYVMHVTMLVSGFFFFWRVLDPRPAPLGAGYGTRIVMSWAAIEGNIPLGAYIALKSSVLYPAYDVHGRLWGLAALADEQLGGFVIWIPGSMMFVVLLLIVIRIWGARENRLDALRRRGIVPQLAPLSERSAANRGLALRLAAIAAVVGAGVVAVAILQQFVP